MYRCIMEDNNGNNGGRKRKVQEHQESIKEEEEEKEMEEFYALIRSTREMREYLMRRSRDNPSTHPHHQYHLINHHHQEHKVSTSFNGWSFQPEDFIGYSPAKGHHAGTSIAVEKQGQGQEEREDDEEKKENKEDEDGGINNSTLDLNLSL